MHFPDKQKKSGYPPSPPPKKRDLDETLLIVFFFAGSQNGPYGPQEPFPQCIIGKLWSEQRVMEEHLKSGRGWKIGSAVWRFKIGLLKVVSRPK